ncbi:MAG: hypothetical protein M1831_007246 [Alyxoria varia]|nr:MAG: hypothetical protein M1831_007246 [Alyxoria varia]
MRGIGNMWPGQAFACATALFAPIVSAVDTGSDRSVTIWSWPLTASTPQPLAQVSYNTDASSSSVTKYTPPKPPHSSDSQIRIGLYDQKTSSWKGVLTTAESFDQAYKPQVQLLLDEDSGDVHHIGFSSYGVPESDRERRRRERREAKAQESSQKQGKAEKPRRKKEMEAREKGNSELLIQIIKPDVAPLPHLNKPVIVDAEGKLPDSEQEKTFLQKYWWVIAIFLLLQLLTAGGTEDKK